MKAVLLDEKRFSADLDLPSPEYLTDFVRYKDTPRDNDVIIERCQDADIIIVGTLRIGREVIEALPNLKLIQVTSVGTNQVDKDACEAHGVKVMNVPDFATVSVAEHTFMLLLNATRAGIHYHGEVLDGTWFQTGQGYLMDEPLIDIEHLTLGIIGVGAIGKRVSKIARAFGMNVLWAEHKGKKPRNENYTDFETVLAQADIISLHCPLTKETKHLIDKNAIAKMGKNPLLVNVARGPVVDTNALAKAIDKGEVAGYATDVFEQEPADEDDPIVQLAKQGHPRVILSPHHGAGSKAAQVKLWNILCKQVNEFIDKN